LFIRGFILDKAFWPGNHEGRSRPHYIFAKSVYYVNSMAAKYREIKGSKDES
jgi:hypothetical protein